MNKKPSRCGFIALVGAPNAGKSTLLNSLVGAKVSIVTHKAQTTRAQIRGVVSEDNSQVIFIDTPGIFKPKRRLDRAMVHSAWSGAGDADIVALIIDASKTIDENVNSLLKGLAKINCRKILILNKIDNVKAPNLLAISKQINEMVDFEQTFMISALKGDGVRDFLVWCLNNVPLDNWHFPPDQLSDLSLALTAAEITREKLFLRIHEEIPYNATVESEKFEVLENGSYRINQVIYVTREQHKKIILGKNGQTIKTIGASARKEMMEIFETKVHLFLFVKVRKNWENDPERYREMGLDLPKG